MSNLVHPALPTLAGDPYSDLLVQLEASLQAAQGALLARNLPHLERHTREQIELQRKLSQILSGSSAKTDPSASTVPKRILHLTRVYLALLERARLSLRMLANSTVAHATYALRPGTATVELSASGRE